MTTLCLDASMGISGDMTVAALLDLGADEKVLRAVLESLPEKEFSIEIKRVQKAALDMMDFNVVLTHDNQDHDMAYLHGHDHTHTHDHDHNHGDHEHPHGESEHHHHDHSHSHRSLFDIGALIAKTTATDNAKKIALDIFEVLAKAEAKAHGKPLHQVHFHEVGAVDSIVDILSATVCLDNLGIDRVIVRNLSEGYGTVRCQHGILPIPVPAVANIAAEHGLSLKTIDIEGELITPTGAAILAAMNASSDMPKGSYKINRMGIGAGKRQYARPSFLRAMLITENKASDTQDEIVQLEANIDDSTPEVLGYAMDRLLEAGALDVSYSPIFMKKNRPGYLLTVLCKENLREVLEAIIFSETTTIGIRRSTLQRTLLKRDITTVQTPYGEVEVKVCTTPDGEKFYYPEFESVKALALKKNVPFKLVFNAALKDA
mgnify:FL=1